MPDVLAWRKKIGILCPSTNTVVQPDMELMRPPGVTNHIGRIFTVNAQAISNEAYFAASTRNYVLNEKKEMVGLGPPILDAIKTIITCAPDHLVIATSANSYRGGKAGALDFQAKMEAAAGVKVSTGALSLTAALRAYGGIKRIAFLTPYYPIANAAIRTYFTEEGFEVMRDVCLQAPSWLGIAEITTSRLRDTLKQLDGSDVDAIVQSGTNCSMIRLAAAAELFLEKPVIAVNTASYWHALRTVGIDDKIQGLGRLLAEF